MRAPSAAPAWAKWVIGVTVFCLGEMAALAQAPEPAPSPVSSEDLRARIERLEKQNEELLKSLRPGTAPVEGEVVVEKEAPCDDASKAKKPLAMKAVWTNNQAWLETENKAFRIHVGGRAQVDAIWVGAPDNVQFGVGGIGKFEDAVDIRRARLEVDGWFYEIIDFWTEYDFVNAMDIEPLTPHTSSPATVTNVTAPTDVWGSINHIPCIGILRVGNMKQACSLEHLTSSRWLDFLERSPAFDALLESQNNGWSPGIQILNWTENERLTWQAGVWKASRTVLGWNIGDGELMMVGRVTGLPYYEEDGKYMIHLGLSGKHNGTDDGLTRLRGRTSLRNGNLVLHTVLAFVNLNAPSESFIGPELFINCGPLSIQSELYCTWVHDVTNINRTPTQTNVPVPGVTFFSPGFYVQALYFLTGEHRPYMKIPEHNSGAAPWRVVPNRNLAFSPGQRGAWQVGARYSYLDMNNKGINGGQLNDVTIGLNWFLNPNMKFQWNYEIGHRSVVNGTSSGYYQGFGMRMALDF